MQGGPLAALDSPIFDVGTQEGALKLASFVKEQGLSGKARSRFHIFAA